MTIRHNWAAATCPSPGLVVVCCFAARVGCDHVWAKRHAPTMASLEDLTRQFGALQCVANRQITWVKANVLGIALTLALFSS